MSNPEYRPRTDAELVAMTDPARNGPWLVSVALELIEARERLKRIDAAWDEAAKSEEG